MNFCNHFCHVDLSSATTCHRAEFETLVLLHPLVLERFPETFQKQVSVAPAEERVLGVWQGQRRTKNTWSQMWSRGIDKEQSLGPSPDFFGPDEWVDTAELDHLPSDLPQCNSLSSHKKRHNLSHRSVWWVQWLSAERDKGASYPNLLFSFKQDSRILLLSHQVAIEYRIHKQLRQTHHITQLTRKHNQGERSCGVTSIERWCPLTLPLNKQNWVAVIPRHAPQGVLALAGRVLALSLRKFKKNSQNWNFR